MAAKQGLSFLAAVVGLVAYIISNDQLGLLDGIAAKHVNKAFLFLYGYLEAGSQPVLRKSLAVVLDCWQGLLNRFCMWL